MRGLLREPGRFCLPGLPVVSLSAIDDRSVFGLKYRRVLGMGAWENLAVPNRRVSRFYFGVALAFLLGACSVSQVRACPNCKEAVNSSEAEVSNASMGYNWSIFLMLSVPFSMLSTGIFIVRRAVKRGVLPEM
jgi:hypothetical protein